MCKKSKIHRMGQRTCPSDLLVSRHRLIYLLSLCLVLGLAGSSKAAVIGFQAESGTLGEHFDPPIIDANALGGQYITIEITAAGGSPGSETRVATYTVTFPEAGTYDFYARLMIEDQLNPQAAADNDSMFYGNGFGTKTANSAADWLLCNGLDMNPFDEYGWFNLTEARGYGNVGVSFTVPEGELTQTFQVGAREDGLRMDAFVFSTVALTDWELDAAVPQETKAFAADPANGSLISETSVNLSWLPGAYATEHHVYFSEVFDNVDDRTAQADKGLTTEPNYAVSGLVPGTVYYWAVDEVSGSDVWPGDVWSFEVQSLTAYDPYPYDGDISIDANVVLAWSPGISAVSHNVYLDTVKANVDARSGCLVDGVSTTEPNYSPGPLDFETTYYWAVDEVGGPPDNTIYTGAVWSFTTMPDIQISDPNLIGWWTFDEGGGSTALDWSGHGNHGAIQGNPAWVSGYRDYGTALDFDGLGDYVDCGFAEIFNITDQITVAAWIRVDLFEQTDQAIVSRGQNVWRLVRNDLLTNQLRFDVGTGQAIGSTNVNDGEWHHALGLYNGSRIYLYVDGLEDGSSAGSGLLTTDPNMTVWIADTNRPGSGPQAWNGVIDDVRIYNKALTQQEIQTIMRIDLLLAWNPNPMNNSMPDIEHFVLPLTWSPGENAIQHDVYFGTSAQAVDDADASDTTGIYRGRQDANTYTPDDEFQWGQPYYWRIDEYNNDETISKGRVWRFTIADFLLVDDFEDYNDTPPQTVWNAWRDGYSDPMNGSQVGHDEPGPYAELTIVNSGNKSMPLYFDNTVAGLSEATRTLDSGRDWTRESIKALSLWFRGYSASVGSFVESPPGAYTMTGSGTDIVGSADEFHFAYKTLTGPGSIVAKVESLQNTNEWAKAGVMIRNTLDADSAFAMSFITPGNGVVFEYRLFAGDESAQVAGQQTGITAPHWVKLERDLSGRFSILHSADGTTWESVENVASEIIGMDLNVYVGLALTSHDAALTCEAVFSNVTIEGNVSGDWMSQDIGIRSNDPEPMYVALANNTGTPVVVYYDEGEPNVTQIGDWTGWNIDLKDFEDNGVDLTDVNSITVGLGNRENPQAGGEGLMYFDDIRLYQPRCVPEKLVLADADLNSDCVVDVRDLEIMAGDWLFGTGTGPSTAEEVWRETESADTISPPLHVWSDMADASGGQYIAVAPGNNSIDDPPAEGVATYVFTVNGGTYRILGRVIAPDADGDSFWCRIEGATTQTNNHSSGWVMWNNIEPGTDWHWDVIHSSDDADTEVRWTMAAGTYTLEVAYREDGALLDRLLITDDLNLNEVDLPPFAADISADDRVDFKDFVVLADSWLEQQLWPE